MQKPDQTPDDLALPADEPRLAPLLTLALLFKLALLGILIVAASHYPAEPGYTAPREGEANDVVWYLSRGFDANAYQRLATEGYYDTFSRNYPLGFPLLIRAVRWVTGNGQTAAVFVANVMGIVAVGLFFVLARRYGRRLGVPVGPSVLLFAVTPGVLVYGTVAYSESSFLVAFLAAWWAYLRSEDGPGGSRGTAPTGALAVANGPANAPANAPADGPPGPAAAGGGTRSLGWLAAASLFAGAAVFIRHLGAPLFLALAAIEGWRVLRSARRGRAVLEALAVLWAGLPLAAYFLWKFSAHDLGGLQQEIWSMRFVPLGGPASLVALGTAPEYVAQIFVTLPLALVLLAKLRAVDGRLALVTLAILFLALSFTGIAAQSTTRYVWTLWPLSLGALVLRDRAVLLGLGGVLFIVSIWCGVGHVLGTSAF